MMRRLIAAVVLAGAALFATPGMAAANVTCPAPVAGLLTLTLNAPSTQMSVDVSAGQIRAFDGPIGSGADACAATDASTTNLDQIDIIDATGGDAVVLLSEQGGAFAPGVAAEATGPEIEIQVTGGGGNDRLEVDGDDGADAFVLGQVAANLMANLNAGAETSSPDFDDVTGLAMEDLVVRGRGGNDDINATGSAANGVDPADPASLGIEGGNQEDVLRGGPGADSLLGGTQDDNVIGGAGDDAVDGGRDQDKVEGGAGADGIEGGTEEDRAFYDDRATAQTVTVANGAADDGGTEDQSGGSRDNVGASVENVTTGSAADSVTGSVGPNKIDAGAGDDIVVGGEGNDQLDGNTGNDFVDGSGGADKVRGQAGADTGLGGSGKDDVLGGDAADRLFGGAGADFVRGDAGKKDLMKGQGGNDRIAAKDKKKDKKIDCGAGKAKKENATVDRADPKPKSC
jgi:Ca2+-binding RTX toxin-like protein